MKYRSDFVTNSSSSSFICVFKSQQELDGIAQGLELSRDEHDVEIGVDLHRKKNRVTRQEVMKMIKEDIHSYVRYDRLYHRNMHIMTYEEMKEMSKDPKVIKEIEDTTEELYQKVIAKLPKKGVYSCLEYGDDDGEFYSDLEHEIMPDMPFMFYRVSHH